MIDKNDTWFWVLNDKGTFTVKSAYRWLQGECDSSNKSFWNKLWSLKLPGRVTHFIWRVCNGCLRTLSALFNKHIVQNSQCPWCKSASETDIHVLFLCTFAQTVWSLTWLRQVLQISPGETSLMIFIRVFGNYKKEQCVQFGMLVWGYGTEGTDGSVIE